MTSTIIGILIALYKFATKAIVNEPLKGHVDLAIKDANGYLIMVRDAKPSQTLNRLSKFSDKMILFSILAFLVIHLLLPKDIANNIDKITLGIFGTSIFLKLSIDWNQEHRKSVKEIFYNLQNIVLLFTPLIIYIINLFFQRTPYSKDIEVLTSLISLHGLLLVQLYWFIALVIIIYFGFWIIAAPVYFILHVSIMLFSLAIKEIDKHIDHNVIEGICSILAITYVILKVMKL